MDGGPWRDLGRRFINSGYTGTIATGRGNPLRGRRAFVSVSRGWGASRADLSDFAGHQVRIRFRVGTDDRHGSYGWYIDDVTHLSLREGHRRAHRQRAHRER